MRTSRFLRHATHGPWGDSSRHLDSETIEAGLATLDPPRDRGTVALLVARQDNGIRETPERARLTRQGGMPGDAWLRDAPEMLVSQITVMQLDVGKLIANGQDLSLFGDNLVVDLDLSQVNLPTGSRLQVGGAVVEVTPEPHDGCLKYRKRFGAEALRAISAKHRRGARLRGIHFQIVEDGEVGIGDPIVVLSRGPNEGGKPG